MTKELLSLVGPLSAQPARPLLITSSSLIAYDEPQSSPSGSLLGEAYKMDLAATVIAAMLEQEGRSPDSRLEMLLKQLVRHHTSKLMHSWWLWVILMLS